jgi:transposase-like protein
MLKASNVKLSNEHKEKAKKISKENGGNTNKQNSISHGIQIAIDSYKLKGNKMHNVECPYCKAELEINHNDKYRESKTIQECEKCKKTFSYTISILFSYNAEKHEEALIKK